MHNPASPGWQPLLDGELAERALQAVREIAGDLRGHTAVNLSLLNGAAGLALFFTYLHQAFPGQGYDDPAVAYLEKAIDGAVEPDAPRGLYSGFTGVGWTIEHLKGRLLDSAGEDPGEEVAEIVLRLLDRRPWSQDFDLLSGLVGYGVYALERCPGTNARLCLERVVAHLGETAERRGGSATWLTRVEFLPPGVTRDLLPRGCYNLGLAHGVPAVIALLAEAHALGIAAGEPFDLLRSAVRWLLDRKLPPGSPTVFPKMIARDGGELGAVRLAWCYGDLCIAVSLLYAARRAGVPDWEREALGLARAAATRSLAASGVLDGCLCHGAAGVAHLFNRVFQATGDPVLGEAARLWLARTLDMRRPGEPFGGFPHWTLLDDGEAGWLADPGFLNGAAGVGLALLAASTPGEPAWDRVMLAAVPRIAKEPVLGKIAKGK
jgi:lantibiotic biosynthesis protein